MLRRGFLRALAELAGLSVLPAPARAVAQPVRRAIVLQHSPLAGFQYHDGEMVWPWLRVGDELQLVREPGNPMDAKAVRVDWEGHKLGYVPRLENHAISQLLDREEAVTAHIDRLEESQDPWRRIGLTVRLWATPFNS
jgi:hypothetical protein